MQTITCEAVAPHDKRLERLQIANCRRQLYAATDKGIAAGSTQKVLTATDLVLAEIKLLQKRACSHKFEDYRCFTTDVAF